MTNLLLVCIGIGSIANTVQNYQSIAIGLLFLTKYWYWYWQYCYEYWQLISTNTNSHYFYKIEWQIHTILVLLEFQRSLWQPSKTSGFRQNGQSIDIASAIPKTHWYWYCIFLKFILTLLLAVHFARCIVLVLPILLESIGNNHVFYILG